MDSTRSPRFQFTLYDLILLTVGVSLTCVAWRRGGILSAVVVGVALLASLILSAALRGRQTSKFTEVDRINIRWMIIAYALFALLIIAMVKR